MNFRVLQAVPAGGISSRLYLERGNRRPLLPCSYKGRCLFKPVLGHEAAGRTKSRRGNPKEHVNRYPLRYPRGMR